MGGEIVFNEQLKANRRRGCCLIVIQVVLYLMTTLSILLTVASYFYFVSDSNNESLDIDEMFWWLVIVAIGIMVVDSWSLSKSYRQLTANLLCGFSYQELDDRSDVWQLVNSLVIIAQIPMPRLLVIDDPSLNSFTIGFKPDKSAIVVTEGLLDTLSKYELEAVLASEIVHIKNGDSRLASWAILLTDDVINAASDQGKQESSVMLFIGGLSYLVICLFFLTCGINGLSIFGLGTGLFLVTHYMSPLVMSLVSIRFLHYCAYQADVNTVVWTHNPDALVAALTKMKASVTMNGSINPFVLLMVNPKLNGGHHGSRQARKDWLDQQLDLYPNIDKRIKRLKQL